MEKAVLLPANKILSYLLIQKQLKLLKCYPISLLIHIKQKKTLLYKKLIASVMKNTFLRFLTLYY